MAEVTTVIELKFDTTASGGAPLGDIASSLVSIDELLRDLATLAAYGAEFREIQVSSMTMRSPMKVTLSLQAIPVEAVKAFQEICRAIIVSRERGSPPQQPVIDAALSLCAGHPHITDQEAQRIDRHIATLQQAAVPLKSMLVKET